MSTTAFTEEQVLNSYPEGIGNHFWQQARNRILRSILHKFPRELVLDLGTGPGETVLALRKSGLNVIGCEPSAAYRNHDKSVLFYNTTFENLPEEYKQKVGTVMLLDVLEHIESPEEFLRKITANYPNLKRFVITVPARLELWSKYDEYYGHFTRYTKQTIEKVVTSAGLVPVRNQYFFHSLYPMVLLRKLSNSGIVRHRKPKKWLHALIGFVFYLEYLLIPGWVTGTSVLIVCERLSRSERKAEVPDSTTRI